MRLSRVSRPVVAWLLLAGPGYVPAAPADPAFEVGAGDIREGYERADYRTRSTALPEGPGRPLDLAGRAQNPPLGLPPLSAGLLPLGPDAVALGRELFFDRRLSVGPPFFDAAFSPFFIVLCILLPPLAVFLKSGAGFHFILNIVLCFFLWLPAVLHALWVVLQ